MAMGNNDGFQFPANNIAHNTQWRCFETFACFHDNDECIQGLLFRIKINVLLLRFMQTVLVGDNCWKGKYVLGHCLWWTTRRLYSVLYVGYTCNTSCVMCNYGKKISNIQVRTLLRTICSTPLKYLDLFTYIKSTIYCTSSLQYQRIVFVDSDFVSLLRFLAIT